MYIELYSIAELYGKLHVYRAIQYCTTLWEAHVLRFKTMKISYMHRELYSIVKSMESTSFEIENNEN